MNTSQNSTENPARKIIRREELLRLLLQGFTIPECAAHMKSAAQTIRKYCREPEFLLILKEHSGEIAKRLVDELATNQVEMAQKLEEASAEALEEMIMMMRSLEQPTKLKLQVCQDLLDRDPKSSRTKRMDITGTLQHDFISPALLIHAAATAKEVIDHEAKKALGNGDGDTTGSTEHSAGS
jgi:hypothetical protein